MFVCAHVVCVLFVHLLYSTIEHVGMYCFLLVDRGHIMEKNLV